MKTIKKLLCLICCLAVVLTLAACGGGQTVSKISAGGDDEATGDNSPYAGIEKYSGSTIHFATWIDHRSGEGAVPMSSFAEKFNIEVELTPINQGDYITKLSGMIGAGQSPDMIVDNCEYPALFPLAADLKQVKSIDLTDPFWDAAVTQLSTIGDKTYFVNSVESPWTYRFMCFYNKKLFEDNNYKSPAEYYAEGNWTISTFEECATRISKLGDDYIGASVRPIFAAGIYNTEFIIREGYRFINNLSDPNLAAAYKWMLSGKEKGIFNNYNTTAQIKNNTMGMLLDGDFGLRVTGGFEGMDPDNLGYVPMPKVNKEDKYYPSVASWRAYGVCKGSKNAEATGYFLRWFLDFDNYDRDTMFMNKEGSDFYDELREIEDKAMLLVTDGVLDATGAQGSGAGVYEQLRTGTSAQVEVNLKAISNTIDSKVAIANKILDETAVAE